MLNLANIINLNYIFENIFNNDVIIPSNTIISALLFKL
jgi:hypothetical protein